METDKQALTKGARDLAEDTYLDAETVETILREFVEALARDYHLEIKKR